MNNQPARSAVTAICHKCGRTKELQALTKNIKADGTYAQTWCCMNCREKLNRGRNFEQMQEISKANWPPIKTFTKKEIAAVAHLYTPPNSGGKKRMILPEMRR